MKIKTWRIIESNPTVSTVIFQSQSCVFILSLSSLVMRKISTPHAWFTRSLLKLRVSPSPMKRTINGTKLFCLTPCAIRRKKEISRQLSAFTSFRNACNERHIFLPWLFLIPQRNLIGADFDHVLGNHFARHTINKTTLYKL